MSAFLPPSALPEVGANVNTGSRRMLWALTAAVLLHIALLFGFGFRLPEPAQPNRGSIEVLLVKQTALVSSPPDPDSVKAEADRTSQTLVPAPELQEPEPEPLLDDDAAQTASKLTRPPQPTPRPEPPARSEPQLESAPDYSMQPAAQPPGAAAVPMVSAADILASRGDEIARLTARISVQTRAYQSRARRKAISTSTREYRYAAYMEAWRRKVERIGNLNYPQEAKEQGLYGNLILHVAVRADGGLEDVRVVHSSGQALLDQAAIRIVELAAPFAAFPADIAAETDILDITRTWQFQRNNRLGWDR